MTDPQGNPVPAANVGVVRQGTQTRLEAKTNADGYFFFPNVQPGEYSIQVQREGFKTIDRGGIRVYTADRRRLDFALEIGTVAEVVNVTADAPLLQTSSAESASVVTSREYERLPQIQFNRMRSPATFLYLSPGVLGQVNNNGRDNVAASNQIQINGSAKFSNELYFDGLPGRTNFNETAPPIDAVAEFKLQVNQISAEYGNSGAAVVTFTSKTGSNEFRGQAFNILRNEKLDARSWLAPRRAPVRQNEFGAMIGGPVWIPKVYDGKNKSFFFFGYSGSRKRGLDQVFLRRIPTPEQRRGDFSQVLAANGQQIRIFDPATTRPNPAGAGFVRDPFPNNQIAPARFDPIARNVTALLPAPNFAGSGALNFQDLGGERVLDPDVYTVRGDQNLGAGHRLGGSYNFTRIPRQNVTAPLGETPLSDRTFQFITSHMIRGSYDWIIRPDLINTLNAGFNRFRNPFRSFFANTGLAQQFGVRNTFADAVPGFSFGDGYGGWARNSLSDALEQSFVLRNTTSWTRGKHLLKFGVEHRYLISSSVDSNNASGSFSFTNQGTALPTTPANTGDSYASFLLGFVQSGSIALPFQVNSRKPYWGFFVQDDYRVTPRLTLNLGFRQELVLAPREIDDQYVLMDPGVANPGAGGRPGALVFAGDGPGRLGTPRLLNSSLNGFGPRFGFAYQVNDKTVLRGGYGIYYTDNAVFPVTTGLRIAPNFASLDAGVTPAFALNAGVPNFSREVRVAPDALNGQSVTMRTGSVGRQPRTQNWSLSLQRELSSNWALELAYAANHNTGQIAAGMTNDNQVDPRFLSLGGLLTQPITSAAAQQAGIQRPYPTFNGTVAQALRLYPQYLTVTEQSAPAGRTIYHGFTSRIRKRYSAGLTFDAHYTWSKNTGYSDTNAAGFGTTNNILQDNFNRRLEWSLLPNDVPNSFVFSYTYELPFGKGKRWGGWLLGGIHRYQSGVPLSVLVNNTLPIFSRALRPNVVSGVERQTDVGVGAFSPSRDRRINLGAFANPAPFSFGTSAPTYGDLRQFPVLNEDFSLVKSTKITERVLFDFTAQFINAFNRHRFADINTNFSAPTFGQASGTNIGRIVTLGAKLRF